MWRRGWDSNPRSPCDDTRSPGVPDRPLQHLSQGQRRGWDSNPRSRKARPLFESGSINHSDTSPSLRLYTCPMPKAMCRGIRKAQWTTAGMCTRGLMRMVGNMGNWRGTAEPSGIQATLGSVSRHWVIGQGAGLRHRFSRPANLVLCFSNRPASLVAPETNFLRPVHLTLPSPYIIMVTSSPTASQYSVVAVTLQPGFIVSKIPGAQSFLHYASGLVVGQAFALPQESRSAASITCDGCDRIPLMSLNGGFK